VAASLGRLVCQLRRRVFSVTPLGASGLLAASQARVGLPCMPAPLAQSPCRTRLLSTSTRLLPLASLTSGSTKGRKWRRPQLSRPIVPRRKRWSSLECGLRRRLRRGCRRHRMQWRLLSVGEGPTRWVLQMSRELRTPRRRAVAMGDVVLCTSLRSWGAPPALRQRREWGLRLCRAQWRLCHPSHRRRPPHSSRRALVMKRSSRVRRMLPPSRLLSCGRHRRGLSPQRRRVESGGGSTLVAPKELRRSHCRCWRSS